LPAPSKPPTESQEAANERQLPKRLASTYPDAAHRRPRAVDARRQGALAYDMGAHCCALRLARCLLAGAQVLGRQQWLTPTANCWRWLQRLNSRSLLHDHMAQRPAAKLRMVAVQRRETHCPTLVGWAAVELGRRPVAGRIGRRMVRSTSGGRLHAAPHRVDRAARLVAGEE